MDAEYYNSLGVEYYKLGDYEEAVECFEKAMELDPANETIKENLKSAINEMDIDDVTMFYAGFPDFFE